MDGFFSSRETSSSCDLSFRSGENSRSSRRHHHDLFPAFGTRLNRIGQWDDQIVKAVFFP